MYTKWHYIIPNDHKAHQRVPFQDPPKCTQIGSFGLKVSHLATLLRADSKESRIKIPDFKG
jgi:hypothetical protein